MFLPPTSSSRKLARHVRRLVRKSYQNTYNLMERWLQPSRHRCGWPHHVLFIAGLPKSGTTWMAQLLEAVPGYKGRWLYDPDNCVSNHDVCDAVFANQPWDLYTVLKLHTRFTPANLAVIEKYDLRTVIMYRDLRDQCISRYFHVLCDPRHRHHTYYNEASREDGVSHCIEITLEESMPWIQGWLPLIAHRPDRFHEVRYEDLRADPCAVLSGVLDFYEVKLAGSEVTKIVERIAATTTFDLRANLRSGKGTARQGTIGDWRNYFTTRHVQRFKEGCGEFLVQLGYEQSLDWMPNGAQKAVRKKGLSPVAGRAAASGGSC